MIMHLKQKQSCTIPLQFLNYNFGFLFLHKIQHTLFFSGFNKILYFTGFVFPKIVFIRNLHFRQSAKFHTKHKCINTYITHYWKQQATEALKVSLFKLQLHYV